MGMWWPEYTGHYCADIASHTQENLKATKRAVAHFYVEYENCVQQLKDQIKDSRQTIKELSKRLKKLEEKKGS